MSGIGEFAYTILLGWMRAVVDWFWSMFSGTGNTGVWNWFLSNWKIWIVILLVGGVVVDWLMWVVRWRPYRLLFGKAQKDAIPESTEMAEDDENYDENYYEVHASEDAQETDWKDTTFATLSEIDPDWANGILSDQENEPLYDPNFDPSQVTGHFVAETYEQTPADGWYDASFDDASIEEEPMELPSDASQADYDPSPDEWPPYGAPADGDPAYGQQEMPEEYYDYGSSDTNETYDAAALLPDAEYEDDATYEDTIWEDPETEAYDADMTAYEGSPDDRPDDDLQELSKPHTDAAVASQVGNGGQMYGRLGYWPVANRPVRPPTTDAAILPQDEPPEPSPEPTPQVEEPYDPLFNPDATPQPRSHRRRRRIHESSQEQWGPEDPISAGQASRYWEDTPTSDPPPPAYGARPVDPGPMAYGDVPPALRTTRSAKPRSIPGYLNEQDPMAETRPTRVVRPAAEMPAQTDSRKSRKRNAKKENEFRTVTGKPAKPRGLFRFTSAQDEPIAGLPRMNLTDPFLPAVQPDDVDFADDDGEEFDR